MRNYFIQKRCLAALFNGILMDRKNKESVHNRHVFVISSRDERDGYEYNTNTTTTNTNDSNSNVLLNFQCERAVALARSLKPVRTSYRQSAERYRSDP